LCGSVLLNRMVVRLGCRVLGVLLVEVFGGDFVEGGGGLDGVFC